MSCCWKRISIDKMHDQVFPLVQDMFKICYDQNNPAVGDEYQ